MRSIRVAIISGSKAQRNFTAENLMRGHYGEFNIVYRGSSLSTHFKQIEGSRSDLILLTTGSPNTFSYEIDPRFRKVKESLPETRILLRTELEQKDPFVMTATKSGVSVIDERADLPQIIDAIRRTVAGEQVICYLDQKNHDLEIYRSQGQKEAR